LYSITLVISFQKKYFEIPLNAEGKRNVIIFEDQIKKKKERKKT
jgi:hypothetical protein